MANKNYVLLERVTVGEAGAASVTFNSIPQTGYTDLKIVASARITTTGGSYYVRLNGDATDANYIFKAARNLNNAGSSFGGSRVLEPKVPNTADTASTFSNDEFYIPNYTSATYKSISLDNAKEINTASYDSANLIFAGTWNSTAAVTSVTLINTSTFVFQQYSSFSLYGLAAVGTTPTRAPKATGGSIIQTDGTYWYHAFLASGTFTPAVGLSCDVLVVAGGGGGTGNAGGGGGAGGLLGFTSQSISTAQTVTVGGGGAGAVSTSNGTVGVDSQFGSLTLVKGGGYGGTLANAGGNGGSGGGGGNGQGVTRFAGGTATSGQGNNGGIGNLQSDGVGNNGGGGGGAGAVGQAAPTGTTIGGAGGIGSNAYSSWATATSTGDSGYYAGGGGGGCNASNGANAAGGTGGGGFGATTTTTKNGGAGTANTGGGGGAGQSPSSSATGGKGGSGIVIIRYAV